MATKQLSGSSPADLDLALGVLAGPDGDMATSSRLGLPGPRQQDIRSYRVRTPDLSHQEWISLDERRVRIRAQWHALFREFDVVISPPLSVAAYPHDFTSVHAEKTVDIDGQQVVLIDQLVWPAVATLAGLPATVLPIDRTADGLPIGMQIMGAQFEDRTTIGFASLIEREFGGFQAPPLATQPPVTRVS